MVGRIEAVADAFGGRHVSEESFAATFDQPGCRGRTARRAGAAACAARPADCRGGVSWSALSGPTVVPELLRRTQAVNLGQLIDVWHFDNNGGDSDAVRGPVTAVQLNDGPGASGLPRPCAHCATAARRGRADVAGLVGAVLRTGFTGPWCVEVNTPEFRALPAAEAARRAVDAASAVLEVAGAPRSVA